MGVVSEAGLLRKEERREGEPPPVGAALTDERLMTAPSVTVRGAASLARPAGPCHGASQVKRLPVVGARGMLKGMVSQDESPKGFLRSDEDIARDVREHVAARLFPGAWRSWPSVAVEVDEGASP